MRLPAFLLALCLAAMVGFGAAVSSRQATTTPSANIASPQSVFQRDDKNLRTAPHARGVVVELNGQQVERNRVALESLRSRVAQAERETSSFWLVDPNVRQQLFSQVQLMRQLLTFAEQQQSNKGKSPTALAVEQRLNQLEGQTMCEGCHSGIVAQNHGSGIHAAQ